MALRWSFSGDRCFRRCQRLYFFRDIAAHHSAKDPFRREAFLLKQLKSIELWLGSLVHMGIERFVIPSLKNDRDVDWSQAVHNTVSMAERQLEFSAKRRYREKGITKTSAGDDYCALIPHELGQDIDSNILEGVHSDIERSLLNLKAMKDLWELFGATQDFWTEVTVPVKYDGASIAAQLDLLFFRGFGKPTIIDWKVSKGGSRGDARLQTTLYAWAMCRSKTWQVDSPEDVQLLEVQLLDPGIVTHPCNEEIFLQLEDKIYRSLVEIRALRGSNKFKDLNANDFSYADNPNSCTYCAFRPLCRRTESNA